MFKYIAQIKIIIPNIIIEIFVNSLIYNNFNKLKKKCRIQILTTRII